MQHVRQNFTLCAAIARCAAIALPLAFCTPPAPVAPSPEHAGIVIAGGTCREVSPDFDLDDLADTCEYALATAFAPVLMIHHTRCTPPPARESGRIPGGYFHAAQPVHDVVRLVYLPAYYRDCGWSSPWCVVMSCEGHAGDSELIAVDIQRLTSGAWATMSVFLSAHCFGTSSRDCRWYEGPALDQFEWSNNIERGAPIVWVSDARNANYPSLAACERGHGGMDACDRNAEAYRFPVSAARNIGSRGVPMHLPGQAPGCVAGAFVEPADRLIVSPTAVECFWSRSAPFGGWQGGSTGVTAYGRYLEYIGL